MLETGIIWVMSAIFAIICLILGRKIRFLPVILLTFFVTFFALLTPAGKIIFEVKSLHFYIAADSLAEGLRKSGILLLSVFISRAFVSSKVRIPGRLGEFFSEVFTFYEKLTSEKISVKKRHLIKEIDSLLAKIWEKSNAELEK